MAKEHELFAASRNKLQALCDENMLTFSFSEEYPITLTVRPQQGLDSQMSMLEMADDVPFNSPNATIVFKMEDGALTYYLSERFIISDALFSKIKGLFVKMHSTYLQAFHRAVVTQKLIQAMPDIGSSLSTDNITETLDEVEVEIEADELEAEAPDFPEDLLDGDEEPSDHEISYDTWLLNEASNFAKEEGALSIDMLMKKFTISFSKAAWAINELTCAGIISNVSGEGGVRAYIEEDEGNG